MVIPSPPGLQMVLCDATMIFLVKYMLQCFKLLASARDRDRFEDMRDVADETIVASYAGVVTGAFSSNHLYLYSIASFPDYSPDFILQLWRKITAGK